jgi:hypothetical protein
LRADYLTTTQRPFFERPFFESFSIDGCHAGDAARPRRRSSKPSPNTVISHERLPHRRRIHDTRRMRATRTRRIAHANRHKARRRPGAVRGHRGFEGRKSRRITPRPSIRVFAARPRGVGRAARPIDPCRAPIHRAGRHTKPHDKRPARARDRSGRSPGGRLGYAYSHCWRPGPRRPKRPSRTTSSDVGRRPHPSGSMNRATFTGTAGCVPNARYIERPGA